MDLSKLISLDLWIDKTKFNHKKENQNHDELAKIDFLSVWTMNVFGIFQNEKKKLVVFVVFFFFYLESNQKCFMCFIFISNCVYLIILFTRVRKIKLSVIQMVNNKKVMFQKDRQFAHMFHGQRIQQTNKNITKNWSKLIVLYFYTKTKTPRQQQKKGN